MPTLTQLEYALAIDRERHFGKAAQSCHVSQPSLSSLLIKLEAELGYAIFDRTKKPIVTTDDGENFLREAREIMTRIESLGQIKNGDQTSGVYRFAIIPTMAPSLLPRLIPRLAEELPKVDFHIFEMKTSDIIRALARDEIDGAILATPLNESGIHEEPLFYEPFLFYSLAKETSLKKRDSSSKNQNEKSQLEKNDDRKNDDRKNPIKESQIEGENLWLIGEGHCFRGQVMQLCQNTQRTLYKNIHLDSSGMETVLQLASATEGSTLVPYLSAEGLPSERLREFAKPWPAREVSLVTSRPKFKAKIHMKICEIITSQIPKELKALKNRDVRVVGLSKN